MAGQWRSKTIDLLTFMLEPLWCQHAVPARVEAVESLPQATHIWLRPAMRWAWPEPGQFITVLFAHGAEQVQRCYSVSAVDQANDRFRITVCKVPGGLVSSELVPALVAGTTLRISAAVGEFVSPTVSSPLWLWAAGSGITPMLPLAEQALAAGQPVNLLYLFRGRSQALMTDEWRALQQRYPQQLCIERIDTAKQARPNDEALQQRLAAYENNAHGYLCGPAGFLERVEALAKAVGIPVEQLHIESFSSAAPRPVMAATELPLEAEDVVAKVHLTDGREVAVLAGQTILQAVQAAGIVMPSCCGQGVCRSCETRKLSGAVENIKTGLQQLREGEWILPCISMPLSDVELAV